MAKKQKASEVEEVQDTVETVEEEAVKKEDAISGFIDKHLGIVSDEAASSSEPDSKEESKDDDVNKIGISESLDLTNFATLINEESPSKDGVKDTPTEFSEMDEEKKQEYAQNDPDVTVDLSQLKESNKKSIYDLIAQRDGARTHSKSLEKQISVLEKSLESRPTETKMEEYKGQVNELTNRLGYYEVSETPEFMNKVQVPREEIKQTLYDIAQQYGIEKSEIERSIGMPIKQRMEFLRDSYPDYLSAAGHHLSVLDRLSVVEKRLREDHPKIMDEHNRTVEMQRAKATAQGKKHQQDKLSYLLDLSIKSAQDNQVPFFIKKGEENHDVVVDGVFDRSKEVIMSNDPNEILGFAVLGASVPAYHKELYKALSRVKELEGKVSKMTKASPGSTGKATSQETTTAKKSSLADFLDEVAA